MRRRRSHAGLTFLEVVVSLAILAGVSSIVLGTVGFLEQAAARDARRLDATEVAHRVIVQYIDDPSWLENQPKRYVYNERPYVFEYLEQYLIDGDEPGGDLTAVAKAETTAEFNKIAASAMRVITVTVWLEGPDGFVEDEPLSTLSRTYWLGRDERSNIGLMQELFEMVGSQQGADE